MTRGAWKPLFSGESSQPYREVVRAIADAAERNPFDTFDPGRPLLQLYLAQADRGAEPARRAEHLIDLSVNMLANGMLMKPSLHGGFAGIGWLSAHADRLKGSVDDEAYEEIDKAVLQWYGVPVTPSRYDLISGHVGAGVYFLERLPCDRAQEGLRRVVATLRHGASRDADSVTWRTHPALLVPGQREMAPNGYYNVGVAHGVPGVVGLLGEIRRSGVAVEGLDDLLHGSIRWVLAQRLADGLFPSWVTPGRDATPSRIGWCYGALGVSVVLLLAARALGDRAIEREALDIALQCAATRGESARVADSCLCHGAFGAGHLFNRLFHATARPELRDAAIHWFEVALTVREDGAGTGGHRARGPHGISWEGRDTSLVQGATGIALACLAATTEVEPAWDRLLLSGLEPLMPE